MERVHLVMHFTQKCISAVINEFSVAFYIFFQRGFKDLKALRECNLSFEQCLNSHSPGLDPLKDVLMRFRVRCITRWALLKRYEGFR